MMPWWQKCHAADDKGATCHLLVPRVTCWWHVSPPDNTCHKCHLLVPRVASITSWWHVSQVSPPDELCHTFMLQVLRVNPWWHKQGFPNLFPILNVNFKICINVYIYILNINAILNLHFKTFDFFQSLTFSNDIPRSYTDTVIFTTTQVKLYQPWTKYYENVSQKIKVGNLFLFPY